MDKITELQIQLMINRKLFSKNIIDEKTYSIVNDKLLKMIKQKEESNELL